MSLENRNHAEFIKGTIFGFAAGCLIGVFYAPQSGRRTRRRIAAAVEDGADHVKSRASHLIIEASELLDRGKEVITR